MAQPKRFAIRLTPLGSSWWCCALAAFAGITITGVVLMADIRSAERDMQALQHSHVQRIESGIVRKFAEAEHNMRGARIGLLLAGVQFHGGRRIGGQPISIQDPTEATRLLEFRPLSASSNSARQSDDAAGPEGHEAFERAIRTGAMVLSAPVQPKGDARARLMMVLPVYQPLGKSPDQPQKLEGLLISPILVEELLGGLRKGLKNEVEFQVLVGSKGSEDPLFDSRGHGSPLHPSAHESWLSIGGQTLTLRVSANAAEPTSFTAGRLIAMSVAGLLATAALVWAALRMARRRARSTARAQAMVQDLRRLATVVEHTSNAVIGMDLGLKVLWVNEGFTRTTGWQPEECVGRPLREVFSHPDGDPSARAALRQAAVRGESCRVELINRRKDGSAVWMNVEIQPTRDETGRINGWIEIALDISHRKRVEDMLQKREHLMRVITDNIPARVSYWEADLRCRFVNQTFCDWFGLRRETMLDQPMSADWFGVEVWQTMEPRVQRVLAGEPQLFEHEDRGASGACASWLVHYLPDVEPKSGKVRGMFALDLDITELKKARDAALQASQAKSQFLSNMTHELRTPMNAVLGMLALLEGTALDNRQADYARKAHGAASALLDLLNDVLDLSKVEAGKMTLNPRPFCFEDLLRELSTLLAVQIGAKPVEVVYEVDARLPARLLGDDVRLRQILINLCGNAIKFTERGEVVVTVRHVHEQEGRVRIRLSVQDSGIGMNEEELGRLFQEFTQANGGTTRRFGGTGLGLSICQRLAGLMGTRIEVISRPGHGSCFTMDVEFPVETTAPALPDALQRALVIDDNPRVRSALAVQLRQLGYMADVAASVEQGMALCVSQDARYAAVLVDWSMPGLAGWEGVRSLRSLPGSRAARTLALATAREREAIGAGEADLRDLLDGCVTKPSTASMLHDALTACARAGDAAAQAKERKPQRLSGLSLLVAEDNLLNQQVARELLEREGALVRIAGDGLQAVTALREQSTAFDMVLMDLQMPVMDGFTATAQIRALPGAGSIPVIAMTANAMDSDRQACLDAGMNGHVGKPFAIDNLVQVVLAHAGRGFAQSLPSVMPVQPAPAAGPAAGQTPTWDRDRALENLGGDVELLQNVLDLFRLSLAETLEQLPALVGDSTRAEAVRHLHTLKGHAGTMAARQLEEASKTAETILKRPQVDALELEDSLQAVYAAVTATQAALPAESTIAA